MIELLTSSIQINIEDERLKEENVEQRNQYTRDLINLYGELLVDTGMDISGLQTVGESVGGVVTYWAGYIENDPYLIEQVDLQNNLKDLSFELNPIRKIKKLEKFADSLKIISKLKSLDYSKIEMLENGIVQYIKRGWSKKSIEEIIKKPKKIGKSTNNYQGSNSPATVYYNSDNEYIVVENSTNMIIQISDKNDSSWIIDSRIYDFKNY